jgi:hypothetical protein
MIPLGVRIAAFLSVPMVAATSASAEEKKKVAPPQSRQSGRVWVSFGVTANPTAEWISRQVTEAFPWDHAPRYLIRDRDTSYGPVFLQRIRAMGIRDHPIAPRSPWQNAYVERLIGPIRRECLDHMIVFGEAHLRRILRGYAAYYNVSRTHRSLNKDAPLHRAIERLGAVVSRPVLGGLHHQYCRINFSAHTARECPILVNRNAMSEPRPLFP